MTAVAKGPAIPVAAPGVPSTLADLPRGESARIVGLSVTAPEMVCRRLRDLGFRSEVEIENVRCAPLGDPVVFRLCGYEMRLRRAEARHVLVDESWAGNGR